MARTVIGRCNLCFEIKKLAKGHILPRWSSRLDGGARSTFMPVNNISTWRETTEGKIGQGLITEYLFCGECDSEFGVGEDLLRQIIHPSSTKPSSIPRVYDFILELNDQSKVDELYRAAGGLLLKAHLAQQEGWKDFCLSKKQRNVVFNGIKNANLSKNMVITLYKIYKLDYFKIGNFTDKIEELKVLLPHDIQLFSHPYLSGDGVFNATFVFGGLIMEIDVYSKGIPKSISRQPHQIPIFPMDTRYLIQADGSIGIPSIYDIDLDMLMDAIMLTILDLECPCRVSYTNNEAKERLSYRECCYIYWDFSWLRNQTEDFMSALKIDNANKYRMYKSGILKFPRNENTLPICDPILSNEWYPTNNGDITPKTIAQKWIGGNAK